MRDQTAREPKFPVACARCGGRISEPVAFCPHCGAHARFALAGTAAPVEPTYRARSVESEPRARGAAAHERFGAPADDFEGDLDPPWPGRPTPLFASPDGDPYGGVRAPAFRGSRQWGFKGGTALVVAGFIVLYGGAVAIHRYDGAAPLPQPSASKSVEGAIAPNGTDDSSAAPPVTNGTSGANVANGARLAPPPAAALAPASMAPPAASARIQPSAVQDAMPDNGRTQRDPRSAQAPGQADDTAAVADTPTRQSNRSRPQRGQVPSGRAAASYALASAQAQLSKSDLRGARASLARALSADPRNGDALALRDQLLSREQARDASLSEAHACVVQARWNCVWHNAGKALSIDASSTEARALVDRAIVESGAATAPAGPGPDNVEVPMAQ